MRKRVLQNIFTLRMAIGYLGESEQYSWWSSSFFSPTSAAFLAPVFSKTSFAAQYYGVREAAAAVHDERIGIGKGVFHLFRLPETYEIEIHRLLDSSDAKAAVQEQIKNKEAAVQFLSEFGEDTVEEAVGPFRLGDTKELSTPKTWVAVAGLYVHAFKNGNELFPYFSTS